VDADPRRQPRVAEYNSVQIRLRDGAWVAEATGLVSLSSWPAGAKLILASNDRTPARRADHRR
jgi:hypothetical protein